MGEKKFLIIQTAFIGDVVLATPLAQTLRSQYPDAKIHLLVRKGNEPLLANHPSVDYVFAWRKKEGKYRQLFNIIREIRQHRYDEVYNLQRFFSSGLITAFSRSKNKVGFDKNPLSFLFSRSVPHNIPAFNNGKPIHEVERNMALLQRAPETIPRPQLYPSPSDFDKVQDLVDSKPYFVIAPASVWFTKQWPLEKWQELMKRLPLSHSVFLVGAPGEKILADKLKAHHPKAKNLCGELSMLQTVALMDKAVRVFTNDSAPLHFASAANAHHTAVFCSTVPAFGFSPLSENGRIAETNIDLACRPCGLHGRRACPLKHFNCAHSIDAIQVFNGVEYYEAIKKDSSHAQLMQVANYFLEKNKVVGFHAADGEYLVTTFKKYETLTGFSFSEDPVLIVRDATVLKYFVKEVPAAVFAALDENPNRDVILEFPSINSPDSNLETSLHIPIIISRHPELQKFMEQSSAGALVLAKMERSKSLATIAGKLAFYLSFKHDIFLNNTLRIKVTKSGQVEIAK